MRVNVVSESAFTVQAHGVHTAFIETIDELKAHTDYNVLVNSSEPADIIHIHTVGPYCLRKLLFYRGKKVVSAHVTPDSFVGSLVGARLWYGLARLYLRWFYNRADGVLAVSQEVLDELTAMGVKRPLYLVPNTIDTQRFVNSPDRRAAARKRLGIAADAFVVLSNGQVQPRKRIDVVVKVARELPELTFMWVGGMPFKALAADSHHMGQLMRDHPENLTFTGIIPREEVVDTYRAADLFFLPSDQETFGIVIVEAAAAGLPIILRDLEQYRTTFVDAYERGNDKAFARIIERFAQDKTYYNRWRQRSAAIAKKYSAAAGAERLSEIYAAILSSSSK